MVLFQVLYRPDGQHDGKLYSTHKHSIEVPIPRDGEYVVEVRAHSDGGDGVVSQVKISGKPVIWDTFPLSTCKFLGLIDSQE